MYNQKLLQLALLDFKLRYNQTILGVFWSFLKPLALILTLLLVFSFLSTDIENFLAYLILGVITWTFFSTSITRLLNSFNANKDFIKKIKFEKQLLLQSALLVEIFNYLILLLISIIVMSFLNTQIFLSLKIFIPLISLVILIYGLGLILSTLFIYFKDLEYITELALQLGFFLTPIFYEVTIIPEEYRSYYLLNPVTRVLESIRTSIFEGSLQGVLFESITFLISASFLLVGLLIFKKLKNDLVDEL